MPKRNIIVIGGSTGSFEALKTIAAGLPKGLEASVFIVWHMAPVVSGVLAQAINAARPLGAAEARDGEVFEPGRIYVARADHHLLIDGDKLNVTRGPKENRFRPAIDPLFRSAAYSHRNRVIGVILSGALDDGTSGLWVIKQRGGIAIVQDPNDAEIASMPESAIQQVNVDHILPVAKMAPLITRLSQEEVPEAREAAMSNGSDKRLELEIKIAGEEYALETGVPDWGELSPFACPECSGVPSMLRDEDGGRPRFRCHTWHAYSADALLSSLTENIEESLWGAIRGVDESIMLLNHLGDHFAEANQAKVAAKFFQKAREAGERNPLLRRAVFEHERLSTGSVESSPEVPTHEPLPA